MTTTDRPNLSLDVLFQIETAQNQIHLKYRTQLEQMQMPTDEAEAERLKYYPAVKYQPPMLKSPHSLRLMLSQYATFLLECEVAFYPNDPQLKHWLEKLGKRIQGAVIGTIIKLQQVGIAKKVTLMYHGVDYDMMRETIAETLATAIDLHLRERIMAGASGDISAVIQRAQSEIDAEQKLYNETARHLMGEPRREETATQVAAPSGETTREGFIKPLLLKRGWSLNDWALEADVAYNTVAGYLAGKKTYPSTRVKLAKVLGLEANQLP